MGDINSGVVGNRDFSGADTGVNRASRVVGFTDPRLQAIVQSLFPQFAGSPNVNAPVQPGPSGGIQAAPNPVPLASNPSPTSAAPPVNSGQAPLAGPNPFASLIAANPVAPAASVGGTMSSGSPAATAVNPAQTNVALDPTVAFVMSLFGQGPQGGPEVGGGGGGANALEGGGAGPGGGNMGGSANA